MSTFATPRTTNPLPLENQLPAELPRLTGLSQELDTSPAAFGELESSMHLIDDAEALRVKMREEGYLYLPGYLDREKVLAARDVVASRLEESGALDADCQPAALITNPDSNFAFRPDLTQNNAPLMDILYSGRMLALLRPDAGLLRALARRCGTTLRLHLVSRHGTGQGHATAHGRGLHGARHARPVNSVDPDLRHPHPCWRINDIGKIASAPAAQQ